MCTGSARGPIQLNDGTDYDVTPDYIEYPLEHREAICYHLEKWHERRGTFGPDFRATSVDNTHPSTPEPPAPTA